MSDTAVLDAPTEARLKPVRGIVPQLTTFRVTPANLREAEGHILTLGAMEKEAHAVFDPICDANHKAWKVSTSARADVIDPIVGLKNRLRRECGAVQTQIEHEARRAAEQAAAAQKRVDDDAALAHAAALEAAGDVAGAEAALVDAEFAPAPVIAPVQVETATQYRDEWHFAVDDAHALPEEYKIPDLKAIGKTVTGLKERTKIPGVRVWKEKVAITKATHRS